MFYWKGKTVESLNTAPLKIVMRERQAHDVKDLINPEVDHILLHCVQCDVYFLPKEVGFLKRRNEAKNTWDVIPICPVADCGFPDSMETVTVEEFHKRRNVGLIEVVH